jgi:quinol monooxygenase YgiN
MLVRIAELEIDPERFDEYARLLQEEIECSIRLEPGVKFLFAVALKESRHCVRVIEGYADHAAYEAHLATAHFLKYRSGTAGMVTSLRLLETDPIALGAKNPISD